MKGTSGDTLKIDVGIHTRLVLWVRPQLYFRNTFTINIMSFCTLMCSLYWPFLGMPVALKIAWVTRMGDRMSHIGGSSSTLLIYYLVLMLGSGFSALGEKHGNTC
jgi:hypothetical protein